jgi:hypothetical protein
MNCSEQNSKRADSAAANLSECCREAERRWLRRGTKSIGLSIVSIYQLDT